MDDVISRQAAIAYSISGMTREIDGDKWIRVSEVRESIKTMPSAERKGKWIDITRSGGDFIWKCSECGELNLEDTYFCPNCGSRNREEEKE